MNARCLDTLDAIGSERWNGLVAADPAATVFQTYQWHAAWWATFGAANRAMLIAVEDGERLVGIAPFMMSTSHRLRIVRFIGDTRADYCTIICAGDPAIVVQTVFAHLHKQRAQFDAMELINIAERAPIFTHLSAACAVHGFAHARVAVQPCPALMLDSNGSAAKEVLGKKSLTRHRAHFVKIGGYQVRHLNDAAQIQPYLARFFDQHIARRSVADGASLFLDPQNQRFYERLADSMSGTGWLAFTVVESMGALVAFHFGFEYAGTLVWYKPSFDIARAKASPGEVLLYEIVAYAQKCGLREVDFTIGDEAFKKRFANIERKNVSLLVCKNHVRLWALFTIDRVRRMSKGQGYTANTLRHVLKLVAAARRDGVCAVARRLARGIEERLCYYDCVLLFSRAPCAVGAAVHPGAMLRIEDTDINGVMQFSWFDSEQRRSEYIRAAYDRFRRNHRCVTGWKDGVLIAVAWLAQGDRVTIGEVGITVPLHAPSVIVYDCVTLPPYRRQGVFTGFLREINNRHSAQSMAIYCSAGNAGSRRAIEHNYSLVSRHSLLRVCGIALRWSRL